MYPISFLFLLHRNKGEKSLVSATKKHRFWNWNWICQANHNVKFSLLLLVEESVFFPVDFRCKLLLHTFCSHHIVPDHGLVMGCVWWQCCFAHILPSQLPQTIPSISQNIHCTAVDSWAQGKWHCQNYSVVTVVKLLNALCHQAQPGNAGWKWEKETTNT